MLINVEFVIPVPGFLKIVTSRQMDSLPSIGRIGCEVIESPSYRIQAKTRRRLMFVMQITLSGCCEATGSDGRHYEFPPGSALIFNTQTDITYGYPSGSTEPLVLVYVDIYGVAAVSAGAELIARSGHRIDLGLKHPLIPSLMNRIPRGEHRYACWSAGENARLSWEVMQNLVIAAERYEDDNLLNEAMSLLEGPATNVATVAEQLGLSREHLSRRFTSELGITPAKWQRERRLQQAALLLQDGNPVWKAAAKSGFSSTSYFIQAFKRYYGTTPAAYSRDTT